MFSQTAKTALTALLDLLNPFLSLCFVIPSCARVRIRARGREGARLFARLAAPAFLLLTAAVLLSPSAVRADPNPANDAADIEITIRPSVDRGIVIDTATADMLFLGDVEMGASTQTVVPATVTVVGTVLNTELDLSASITGGWKFDDDVTTQEEDNLAVWSVFTSTDIATAPAPSGSYFDDANDSLEPASPSAFFGPVAVGRPGNDSRFEDGVTNMKNLRPGNKRHWWFRFRAPNTTSTVNDQKITFILSVKPGQ